MLRIERVRSGGGRAMTLEDTWLPAERFPGLLERDLGGSIYRLMGEHYDLAPVSATERLEPVAARAHDAQHLGRRRGRAADARRAHLLRRRRHAGGVRPRPPPRRPGAVRHPRRARRPARPCTLSSRACSRRSSPSWARRRASRSRSTAASPTGTSASRSRGPATSSSACRARTPSCSGSTARPSGRPRRRRPRVGVGPRVVAFRTAPPCLVTAFIPGAPVPPEALRARVEEIAASLRAVHGGPPLRARFDPFAIVDAYRATAVAHGTPVPAAFGRLLDGARRIRAALSGPEHAPVPVPQRPAERELHPRRRAGPDRRLGVRGHGRPLLRPRQPLRQQRLLRRPTTRRCSPPTSASRAPTAASPPCG